MNEITQTNFTLTIMVPNADCEHCVLRMRYLSNNPTENDRGMIFYQCSDVSVSATKQDNSMLNNALFDFKKLNNVVKSDNKDYSCCASQQFTMEGYETSSWRNPTHKNYYFDAENKLFRIDTNSGNGITSIDGHFQMFSNFTSGIEYYYNVNANTCDLYGLNYWSDWCYGTINSQTYMSSITIGSQISDIWTMNGSDFTWTNQRDQCIPIGMNRVSTGETTVYYNHKAIKPDSTLFNLPTACTDAFKKLHNNNFNKKLLKHSPRNNLNIHHL